MAGVEKYTGSCHCGKVRYEVELDLATPVISCNCSMCGRSGTLLTFVPAERFTLLSGEDALTDYQFNRHAIHHLFCSTCGIKSFAKGVAPNGAETRAVNARCLEGVDLQSLTVKDFDGKSR
ncbi:MAG TPA: GFA family protein [Polyangiaceae bacterium]